MTGGKATYHQTSSAKTTVMNSDMFVHFRTQSPLVIHWYRPSPTLLRRSSKQGGLGNDANRGGKWWKITKILGKHRINPSSIRDFLGFPLISWGFLRKFLSEDYWDTTWTSLNRARQLIKSSFSGWNWALAWPKGLASCLPGGQGDHDS